MARDRIIGVWRDKTTGREFQAGGSMVGYLYSQPERYERVPDARLYDDGGVIMKKYEDDERD